MGESTLPRVEVFEEISWLPLRLYHYCPADAFLAILNSRSFWLSEATALNDAQEVSFAHDIIAEAIAAPLEGVPPEAIERVRQVLDLNRPYPFVGALSMLGDQLSQWRGYADDGRGVSIGFDPRRFNLKYYLPFMAQKPELMVGLAPVSYGESGIREAVAQQLKLFARRWTTKEMDEDSAVIELAVRLGQLTCMGKNASFIEEREWRVIHVPLAAPWIDGGRVIMRDGALSDLHFRVSNGTLVPYFAWELPAMSPVVEIILGPKNRFGISQLRTLLASLALDHVTVSRSTASYR